MLKEYGLNKLCSDFLMTLTCNKVEPITLNKNDKEITIIALGTNMTDDQLEKYMSFILGV